MTPVDVIEGRAPWCVVQGDCLEVMATLPGKCADHVVTDPPYEAEAHTMQRRVKRSAEPSGGGMNLEALSFEPIRGEQRESAGQEFARLSKRWTVAFCQVEAAVKWSIALHPLKTKRIGVWVKPDGMPQFSGDRPGMGYESIVFAHQPGRSKWNGGGRVGVFIHNKNGAPGGNDHETQKPLPLMTELVELFTDPGDLVLDPFCGSATTGVACLRLGRRFIGIEKDAKYFQVATDRMKAEERGLTLKDARLGQTSIFDVMGT